MWNDSQTFVDLCALDVIQLIFSVKSIFIIFLNIKEIDIIDSTCKTVDNLSMLWEVIQVDCLGILELPPGVFGVLFEWKKVTYLNLGGDSSVSELWWQHC